MENLTVEQQFALSRMQVTSLRLQASIRDLQDQLSTNEVAFKNTVENFARALRVDASEYMFNRDLLTFVPKTAQETQCRH